MNKALEEIVSSFQIIVNFVEVIVELLIGSNFCSICASKTHSYLPEEKTIREIHQSFNSSPKVCPRIFGKKGIAKIEVAGRSKEEVLLSFDHPELVEECLDQEEIPEDDHRHSDNPILLPRISSKTATC